MKNLSFILLVAVIAFSSCKPDDEDTKTNVPLIEKIITSYSYMTDRDTTINEFDNQGRITKTSSSLDKEYLVYEYSGSKIICKTYNYDDVLTTMETHTLNSNGLIEKTSSFNANAGVIEADTEPYDVSEYFYDNLEHVIKMVSSGISAIDTTFRYFEGDNVMSTFTRRWMSDKLYCFSVTYEYYTDKISTIDLHNYGLPFFGSPTKNLMKKSTSMDESTGKAFVIEYQYEFDEKNRVTKRTFIMDGQNGKDTAYNDFTYEE
jgi:hypothetical protein